MGQPTRPCIIKIGGSLLDWEGLPTGWQRWTSQRPAGVCYWLIAGGGPWVDTIRGQQSIRGWSDQQAHELSIDCLALTAHVLAHRLALRCDVLSDDLPNMAVRSSEAESVDRVINVVPWLRKVEPQAGGTRLPIGWATTSDSIAARVALWLGDLPLFLAKSCEPAGVDWRGWVAQGYVDQNFSQYADRLSHLWAVNLRACG